MSARLGVVGEGQAGSVEKMNRLVEGSRNGLSPSVLSQSPSLPPGLLQGGSTRQRQPPPQGLLDNFSSDTQIPSAERDKLHFEKKTSMAVIRYNVCCAEQNEQKKKIGSQAIIMGVIFQPISKKYLRNPLLRPLS